MRILNAPLHPFDYAAAVEEMRAAVAQYQQAAGGEIDLAPLIDDLAALGAEIARVAARRRGARTPAPGDDAERRRLNATLRQIARLLVPLNYAAASASITTRR